MADPVEVMAEAAYEADPRSGHWAEWSELDSSDPTRSEFIRASSKALSALDAAGFVVVPREPTAEMRLAGKEEHLAQEAVGGFRSDQAVSIYRAMLSAAQVKP